jgi:hypothetical protein
LISSVFENAPAGGYVQNFKHNENYAGFGIAS